MDITALKMIIVIIIFACALLGGLIPIFTKKEGQLGWILPYGEFFARGIFLGVALLHLLPEAMEHFSFAHPAIEYPVILAICAVSIFMIQFIEQGAAKLLQQLNIHPQNLIAYWLLLLLSIHSFIEGLAVGISETLTSMFIITMAIVVHKSSEAFALAIKLRACLMSRLSMLVMITLLALMTPIGILFGSLLLNSLEGTTGITIEAIFSAIAAGTFIYIGMMDTADCDHQAEENTSMLSRTCCFGLGIGLMAVVGLWL